MLLEYGTDSKFVNFGEVCSGEKISVSMFTELLDGGEFDFSGSRRQLERVSAEELSFQILTEFNFYQ